MRIAGDVAIGAVRIVFDFSIPLFQLPLSFFVSMKIRSLVFLVSFLLIPTIVSGSFRWVFVRNETRLLNWCY